MYCGINKIFWPVLQRIFRDSNCIPHRDFNNLISEVNVLAYAQSWNISGFVQIYFVWLKWEKKEATILSKQHWAVRACFARFHCHETKKNILNRSIKKSQQLEIYNIYKPPPILRSVWYIVSELLICLSVSHDASKDNCQRWLSVLKPFRRSSLRHCWGRGHLLLRYSAEERRKQLCSSYEGIHQVFIRPKDRKWSQSVLQNFSHFRISPLCHNYWPKRDRSASIVN